MICTIHHIDCLYAFNWHRLKYTLLMLIDKALSRTMFSVKQVGLSIKANYISFFHHSRWYWCFCWHFDTKGQVAGFQEGTHLYIQRGAQLCWAEPKFWLHLCAFTKDESNNAIWHLLFYSHPVYLKSFIYIAACLRKTEVNKMYAFSDIRFQSAIKLCVNVKTCKVSKMNFIITRVDLGTKKGNPLRCPCYMFLLL